MRRVALYRLVIRDKDGPPRRYEITFKDKRIFYNKLKEALFIVDGNIVERSPNWWREVVLPPNREVILALVGRKGVRNIYFTKNDLAIKRCCLVGGIRRGISFTLEKIRDVNISSTQEEDILRALKSVDDTTLNIDTSGDVIKAIIALGVAITGGIVVWRVLLTRFMTR